MTTYTASLHSGIHLRELMAAKLRSMVDAWKMYRVYKQTKRELDGLSDRELADIGISRWMINEIAHEAAIGGTK